MTSKTHRLRPQRLQQQHFHQRQQQQLQQRSCCSICGRCGHRCPHHLLLLLLLLHHQQQRLLLRLCLQIHGRIAQCPVQWLTAFIANDSEHKPMQLLAERVTGGKGCRMNQWCATPVLYMSWYDVSTGCHVKALQRCNSRCDGAHDRSSSAVVCKADANASATTH